MESDLHRPQFHFTPPRHWMNDPNGLVYYKGEYHLFYQHSPGFIRHAPNSWGHAVSADLLRWQHLGEAIEPDDYGFIWSGSAVVDHRNTSGLKNGTEDPIVAVYTTGGFGDPPSRCVQSIAYSTDRGRSFHRYPGNPVLGHLRAENRDPKIVWHEPTCTWIMVLYLDGSTFGLFGSANLTEWHRLGEVEVSDTGECPDFFELPVDGSPADTRWVFWGGSGRCLIGSFDGQTFTPETPVIRVEHGPNGYAAQTWSDVPRADGRRIQVSWMAGGRYPCMPFNQQLSFPVELSLHRTNEGIRLFRSPVRELDRLHGRVHQWSELTLVPGRDRPGLFRLHGPRWKERTEELRPTIVPPTTHDLFDIRGELTADDEACFVALIRGHELRYEVNGAKVTYLEQDVPAPSDEDRVFRFRILVDRTSLELFIGGGQVSASCCFVPAAEDHPLEFWAADGRVTIRSLVVVEIERP